MRSHQYMGREVEIKVDDTVLVVHWEELEWLLRSCLTAPKTWMNFQTSVMCFQCTLIFYSTNSDNTVAYNNMLSPKTLAVVASAAHGGYESSCLLLNSI